MDELGLGWLEGVAFAGSWDVEFMRHALHVRRLWWWFSNGRDKKLDWGTRSDQIVGMGVKAAIMRG